MTEDRPPENGITPTVQTYFSRCTVGDIIDRICAGKVDAVLRWLDEQGVRPEKTLVIGSYLTGAGLANRLGHVSSVTVVDIHPHLRHFLDPSISFATGVRELDKGGWDFVMDTSGLGGIRTDDLLALDPPRALLAEDPGSDGSDDALMRINRTGTLLQTVPAQKKGVLCTDGLCTKTSGTMTLAVEILRRSMQEASREEGVLYSTASMEFYERILFREKNPDAFQERLKKPALVVSSLREIDCDGIIERTVSTLRSRVVTWYSEDHEGLPVVQEDRGCNPAESGL